MSASAKVFLDTNVLVYAFDDSEPGKKSKALAILQGEYRSVAIGDLVLSTQVLQEFYVSVVRKLGRPLGEDLAEVAVTKLAALHIQTIDQEMVLTAIRRSRAESSHFGIP